MLRTADLSSSGRGSPLIFRGYPSEFCPTHPIQRKTPAGFFVHSRKVTPNNATALAGLCVPTGDFGEKAPHQPRERERASVPALTPSSWWWDGGITGA